MLPQFRVPQRLASLAVVIGGLLTCNAATRASIVVADPAGDTFGVGAVQHDIVSVTSTVTATDLVLQVAFGGPISAPSAFAPNSVVGFIDLDIDQNDVTGSAQTHGPTSAFPGTEFFVDVFGEQFSPGLADVVSAATLLTVGQAPITFAATSFTVTVPLSLLGGDNGAVDYRVVMGSSAEPTDEALGASRIEPGDVVPEAGSLVIWATLGLTVGSAAVSRRRDVRR
jgi:hypothetical protein